MLFGPIFYCTVAVTHWAFAMNIRPTLTSPSLLVSVLDQLDTPNVLVDLADNITFANTA